MNGDGNNNIAAPVSGACAACRHQRKRCEPDCFLAKFFPFEKNADFKCVYYVFGVENTIDLLKMAAEEDRHTAAKSLVFEARMRMQNPVHGSLGYQLKLQSEISALEKEVEMVKKQLEFFKGQKKNASGSKSK